VPGGAAHRAARSAHRAAHDLPPWPSIDRAGEFRAATFMACAKTPFLDRPGEPCSHLQVSPAMTTPAADLADVVLAHLAQDPPRRAEILRPRPRGLPHPWRRLARLQGVVRLPYLPPLTALPGSPAGIWPR